MNNILRPIPDRTIRRNISKRIREEAARVARDRPRNPQMNNGEVDDALSRAHIDPEAWIPAHSVFTKGLEHDEFGRVRGKDLIALVDALNQAPANPAQAHSSPFPGVYNGGPDLAGKAARFAVPLFGGAQIRPSKSVIGSRTFESPLSGHVYELQGLDPDAVGLPPAPELGSDELTAEIAEVYAAALLRDVPFDEWPTKAAGIAAKVAALPFFSQAQNGAAAKRRDARGQVSSTNLFTGSTEGAKLGGYVSQFLLVGSNERAALAADAFEENAPDTSLTDSNTVNAGLLAPESRRAYAIPGAVMPSDGFIRYGVQSINQRFTGHLEHVDHMTEWRTWQDVQNGSNRKGVFDRFQSEARFAATPRDLATYVHFDELEQAYRNAALLLLSSGQPTDRGLPEGSGHKTRDGFASFGGPALLALIGEVSSRALKAVRRQKFLVHLRSRPEALAAALSLSWEDGAAAESLGAQKPALDRMRQQLLDIGLLQLIRDHNKDMNDRIWDHQYVTKGGVDLGPLTESANALLPMAFPEGSPMHADYGAGHAAVAGAAVTILKAFFEMYQIPDAPPRGELGIYSIVKMHGGYPATYPSHLFGKERPINGANTGFMLPNVYAADPATGYKTLTPVDGPDLSIQGELDKLGANIAIGRNFAGVHFYTDYYESLRMGERVAVALLQEQLLTYREPVSMRLKSFDGENLMLTGTGGSKDGDDALLLVWSNAGVGGTKSDADDWWTRHV